MLLLWLCIVVVSVGIVIISSLVKIGSVIAIYICCCFCFVVEDDDDVVVLSQKSPIKSLVKIRLVIDEMLLLLLFLFMFFVFIVVVDPTNLPLKFGKNRVRR